MELIEVLFRQLFKKEQCGGTTIAVNISMVSESLCSQVVRVSTCGGDTTTIQFKPPLLLEEALLKARVYTSNGNFVCSE